MKRQPARIIDVSGEFSPFTLLKISQIFREMAAGDVLEIRECDTETRSDLMRILPSDACRLSIEDDNVRHGNRDAKAGRQERALCRIRLLKTAAI